MIFLSFSAVAASQNTTDDSSGEQILSDVNAVENKTFEAVQTAIDNSNDSDTISLSGTYYGSGSQINITKPLTIEGTGDGARLNAGSLSRVFNVQADNVVLKNLIFSKGSANDMAGESSGGAITSEGDNLTIINCSFISNSAQFAGAIASEGNDVSIIDCNFSRNTAMYTGGAFQLNGDNNYVSNCNFRYNYGYHAGGAVAWVGANGILSNSTFVNDIRDLKDASQFGGAIVWMGANGKVIRSNFFKNTANQYGAAVYWKGINGSLTYCIFENNTSECDFAYWGNPDYADYNYWGFNLNSTEDFIQSKLLYCNGDFASPKTWVILNSYEDEINFTSNDGSQLEGYMPDYRTTFLNSSVIVANNSYVAKKDTILVCCDLATYNVINSKNGKYFQVILKDSNNNVLASKKVQITLNGKNYDVATNAKGIAKLQINMKNPGTYKVNALFKGDDRYCSSAASAKIKVAKQKTSLAVNTKSFKVKTKKKYVKVVLKDQFKKAISKKVIRITINKKTYKAKTNSKGIASIKVVLKAKGNYKFAVKFAGDKYYSKSSKTGSIRVK